MVGLYVLVAIIILMIAYAGVEETLRVFAYMDLQLRFAVLRLRMKWMGWNLRRQLVKETANYTKFIREQKNERERDVRLVSDKERVS
jgi:hypothetical protein